MPETLNTPIGWSDTPMRVAEWRLALGLDRKPHTLPRAKETMPAFESTMPLRGNNKSIWERAMAARQDSTLFARGGFSVPQAEDSIDIDGLRDWLLSDSLDWDAVERARDEGWR